MGEIHLRPWQREAILKCLDWFQGRDQRIFLVNAAPGAGKTVCACVIAKELINRELVDRVVVIAPRREVVDQWSTDFKNICNRPMIKVTASDENIEGYGQDICATWSAVRGLADVFQQICLQQQTLVICDEHHHAAVTAAWGRSAIGAFTEAAFSLVLSGTPIRSDGEEPVWFAYDDEGKIDHPQEGTYTLAYGNAVNLHYCRPITFHRHEENLALL
ncbi:MAG: DEAD/DEAH box helicase [Candidatus Puniceispirillaceae bacterium]